MPHELHTAIMAEVGRLDVAFAGHSARPGQSKPA
jgi:hypothetical protein